MSDEIVKGNTCWNRAAFTGEVADCPCLTKHGYEELCIAGPYAGDCDAEPVYLYPKARHAKTRAALAAADKVLAEFELRVGRRSITFDEIKAARELIRDAKGAEDAR